MTEGKYVASQVLGGIAPGIIWTTRGWSGAEVVCTHNLGTDTFTVSGDRHNALDVALELLSWLQDPARPWGTAFTEPLRIQDDGTGRVRFVMGTGTAITYAPSPAWARRMGIVGEANPGEYPWMEGRTRGSCSAAPGSTMWERWDTEQAARNRSVPWRTGHPTLSHRRPSCELALDLKQAFAFNEALRIAPDPRTAYVYDELGDLWRFVVVGMHDLQRHKSDDVTKVIGTIEVLGVVT